MRLHKQRNCLLSYENELSTHEVVEAVLSYPLLINLFLYNDTETALHLLSEHSDAYRNFLIREDAEDVLLSFVERAKALEYEVASVSLFSP